MCICHVLLTTAFSSWTKWPFIRLSLLRKINAAKPTGCQCFLLISFIVSFLCFSFHNTDFFLTFGQVSIAVSKRISLHLCNNSYVLLFDIKLQGIEAYLMVNIFVHFQHWLRLSFEPNKTQNIKLYIFRSFPAFTNGHNPHLRTKATNN